MQLWVQLLPHSSSLPNLQSSALLMSCPVLALSSLSVLETTAITFQPQCSALNVVARGGELLPRTTSLR